MGRAALLTRARGASIRTEHEASDDARSLRRLPRRSRLPNGRAIAGGLLVAIAGLGLYSAQQSAAQPPATRYVVATRDIAPGERIAPDQLGTAPLELGDELAALAIGDPDELIDRIALSPIRRHELIHRSDVGEARPTSDGPERRVTLELEPAQALDGQLRSGDVVDVVATGDELGSTRVVIDAALVERVSARSDERLGASEHVRLTLVVANEEAATTLIDAARHEEITLVTSSPVHLQ